MKFEPAKIKNVSEATIAIVPALPGFFLGGLVDSWDDPDIAWAKVDDRYSFVPIVAWRIETRVVKYTDQFYADTFASVACPICSDQEYDESAPGDPVVIRSDGKVETYGKTFASVTDWFNDELRKSQAAAPGRAAAKAAALVAAKAAAKAANLPAARAATQAASLPPAAERAAEPVA